MDTLNETLGSFSVETVRNFLMTTGLAFGLRLLAAAVLFVLGRLAARLTAKALAKVLERSGTDPTLVKFISHVLYALLLVFVVVASLEKVGVNTTSVAAVVAAAGLAIGLALQSSLSNFAGGVMIILLRHFRVGDRVEIAGHVGVVQDIQVFNSVLVTDDGTRIILPNGTLATGTMKVLPRATPSSTGTKAA